MRGAITLVGDLKLKSVGQGEQRRLSISTFSRVTWPIAVILHASLLRVMFFRRRAKQFPALTAYLLYHFLSGLKSIYVYMYRGYTAEPALVNYAQLAIGELLLIAIFFELAAHVFRPTGVWAPDVRRAFVLLTLGAVAVAALLTLLDHPIAPTRASAWVLRNFFFTCVLLSELLVGTVVLSATAGLPWKTHVVKVAYGVGAYCLLCLALNIVSNSVGILPNSHLYVALVRTNSISWMVCVVYLSVVLWREAPAPRELPEQMRVQIHRLNQQLETDLVRVRNWTKG